MSGKGEKPDKASGSKMLRKARSFREDFKDLIKRRPSASSAQGMTGSGKPPKIRVSRDSSLGDSKSEADEDLDKLHAEVNNVYRSLVYYKAVVDQEKLQIVPSTATIVLDTVMDVFTLLSSFFSNQDSTTLLSRHNKVCQSLAQFIKWSDDILVHGDKELNKDNAHELITALSNGVEELTQICIDKWDNRKSTGAPPKSPVPSSPGFDGPKRNSLPDIPLTPREQEILNRTSELGIYDNPSLPVSRSSDSITVSNNGNGFRQPSPPPPPKPPLPQNIETILPQLLQRTSQEFGADVPPPLPDKEKRRSQIQSMLEMVSSAAAHGQMTPNNQSPHSSMIISGNTSFTTEYSESPLSQSPSLSPMSKSPSSSVSSGLNQSYDDLAQSGQRSMLSSTFSRTVSEPKMTGKSSLTGSHSERTVHQIEEVTKEINKMIHDISSLNKKQNSDGGNGGEGPPPLPNKKMNRQVSHYDNFPDSPGTTLDISSSSSSMQTSRTIMTRTVTSRTSQSSEARLSSSSTSSSQSFTGQMQKSNTISFTTHRTSSQETYSSSETFSSASRSSMESLPHPPPLPPKQRHIQAYMQTFGAYTQPQGLEYISRHSINFYEAQWHRHQMELSHSLYPRSNTISVISDISSDSSFGGSAPASPIPALPMKRRFGPHRDSQLSTTSSQSDTSADVSRDKTVSLIEPVVASIDQDVQKRSSAPAGQVVEMASKEPIESLSKPDISKDSDSDFAELNPLDDIDVSDQLVRKKEGEEGPDIRGGSVDSLIVHASAAAKSEFMYQEAFLTTYRTFITSRELIDKLLYRFHKFHHAQDNKKKTARNAFSLLIRVVDLLSFHELDKEVVEIMMELVFELLCQGDLMLAKILRRKVIEKCEAKKLHEEAAKHVTLLSSISVTANPHVLTDFKHSDIAEQMTLIDAELFQRIEIPEVLLWAKEQSEELSPNLTQFTEHFNKMSYWCRTRILLQEDAKDREKYMGKFIKIMKHLRRRSNFNSYLAILSALDSAPIRRLEWPKQTTDQLKEFCQLIESSSSFRAYRVALAETEPPCIPYIGLILQDLTFINIGNQDHLPDGSINFAKRWQQFHILDSMRRFRDKKCNYEIKKNEKIIAMFDNFDNYLGEEALWQISEKIKPRGRKKTESEL